jgi:hypothetical protein
MRIAHADLVHVVEGLADVVDAGPARADALRDQARAAVEVELADVGRMRRIGDEGEGVHGAAARQAHRNQPRRIDPAHHLAMPQVGERVADAARVDAVRHAPARAAAAQAHHQAGLVARAAIARRQQAKGAVVTVRAAERLAGIPEARRPHQRAVAEHPELALRQPRPELTERHSGATI